MANEHVLDTHALIWFLEGNPRLGGRARAVMQDPASLLCLPVIALAEACWIVERGRCAIPSVADLLADVDADPRLVLASLDRAILNRSLGLAPVTEMHDRLIVATALHLAGAGAPIPLLTCDGNITASGLVPVVW